jgi:hypothetical protein
VVWRAAVPVASSPLYVQHSVLVVGVYEQGFGQIDVQQVFIEALQQHMSYFVLMDTSTITIIRVVAAMPSANLPCELLVSTSGYLSCGPTEKNIMFSVTSACARRTGVASQAFERMHNTLSHRVKTYVPHGTIAKCVLVGLLSQFYVCFAAIARFCSCRPSSVCSCSC